MPGSRPLQNRVTPFGEVVAVPERGMFMGNRGCLHNARKELTDRKWTTTRWITCVLEYKERRREVMRPGYYTELFFLDEATAFAAGHRPCAECRRGDYNRFLDLWRQVHGGSRRPLADEVDTELHAERVTATKQQRRWISPLAKLPDGTMVTRWDDSRRALLWHRQELWEWSPAGYTALGPAAGSVDVEVLTPPSIVRVFEAGYEPVVQPSAS